MKYLQEQLETLINNLPDAEILRQRCDNLVSAHPFNKYEFVISHLLAANVLSIDAYSRLRDGYIERNPYSYLFEINAPRTFGENWAQEHLKELVPELIKPAKAVDPNYSGEYDFFLDGIRIEVKASRVVDDGVRAPLYVKALASDSQKGFDMNFQQIKPACCDVFVWIAVWRDLIQYWVLSSKEVENNRYYSPKQHLNSVNEGQFHVTHQNIQSLSIYSVHPHDLLAAIEAAYQRQLASC